MVRNEQGVLTYMSKMVNSMARENYVAGRNFVEITDQKIAKALEREKNKDDDELER